jgi:uncharacterized protein YdhG (YjbR/CyaY superfamily)
MATQQKKIETPEEYISTFPKDVQELLQKIRKTIQKAVPEAEEVISYQIPAFRVNASDKYHGWIFYYSAYKNHFSLSCPPPFTIFEVFKKELAPYELSKSAIRFPLDKPVPVVLISEMAKFRAKENLETEANKKKKQK